MNKYLLFITFFLFFNQLLTAQVLYTENFDNHSLGNLGTNVTGTVPGQWGWFTKSFNTQANIIFTIVNETGRGKVLDITSPLSTSEDLRAFKTNLHTTINNRMPGNNVIMFEIDYHTGSKQSSNLGSNHSDISIGGIGDPLASPAVAENLASLLFDKTTGSLHGATSSGDISFGDDQNNYYYIPFNVWVKIIIYLDYPNKKVYVHIPYLNKAFVGDFLKNSTSTNLIQDFAPSTIFLHAGVHSASTGPLIYTRNRYDNIKITALGTVPPEVVNLNNNEQLAAKFNLYPNPATNLVNITNAENMLVNQVTVYDISGRQLSAQSFNEETQIQLNVEKLASGTYMLHLQTNEGIAVKKLVKN